MKKYIEKIYKGTQEEYSNYLKERLINEEKTFTVTANPEILMRGENNPSFDKILSDDNTEIVADGIGVVKSAKLFGINLPGRVTGVELSEHLLKYCAEYNKSVYLFGASNNVLSTLIEKLKSTYPNIKIAGFSDGYVKDKQAVFEEIKKLAPDVVLVALGSPLQEELIYNNLADFNKGIFMGVGGSFDVLSGMKKRAPKIFIKLNLEWLYRIAGSPKRWKRFYDGNIKYMLKLRKEAKKSND